MKLSADQVIKRSLALTEKASELQSKYNQVVFEVDRAANKIQIRAAVEELFGVKVKGVNTLIQHGKLKRMGRSYAKRPNWKKAIVTLREGDEIHFFDESGEE